MLRGVKQETLDTPARQCFQEKLLNCWLALKRSSLKGESTARIRTFSSRLTPYGAAAFLILFLSSPVPADNWPAWRGAGGSGICRETNLPLRWSTNGNVRWCVALPDRGNSTPIVWQERIFITQAIENRRTLICLKRRTGELLWQAGPTWTGPEQTPPDNPSCTPSPVTDGSAGVYCYDLRGRELWHRDLGRQSHMWGYAATPVLDGNLCFVNFGPGDRSFLIALDKRTGKTVWQYDVPRYGTGMKWSDLGGKDRAGEPTVVEIAGSWATPLIVPAGRQNELVVPFPGRLMAFEPGTGALLWTCDGPNIGVYSGPFFGDGVIALNASGTTNTVLAVRPGGRGDVTQTHRLWIQHPSDSKMCLGAGVIHHGHIYQVNMMGFAECRELQTGRMVWQERLTGTGARNASWSAPVLAGDRLYLPNKNADVFVLRASPTFECLATNSIGGEPMNASLAVSEGKIFIRTDRHLWCIGEQ
jgi:outer membrane protein assembly factor BamB